MCGKETCFPLFPVFFFIFLLGIQAEAKNPQICHFEGERYVCHHVPRHMKSKIIFPQQSCTHYDCDNCVTANRTFLLSPTMELIPPTNFILRPTKANFSTRSTTYECVLKTGQQCYCDDSPCTGSDEFCSLYDCFHNSTCGCELTHQVPELIHVSTTQSMHNSPRITFETCMFDRRHVDAQVVVQSRRLFEHEEAVFRQNNLTVSFVDPVLKLPDLGRVILRTIDYEHVLTVPNDLMIVLPFELLAYKTTLTVIYLHPRGHTVIGNIHVTGKSVCQIRQCLLCTSVLSTIPCWSQPMQYTIYIVMIITSVLLLWCLKTILRTMLWFIKLLVFCVYYGLKIIKTMLRCCLLLGTIIGTLLQRSAHSVHTFMEIQAQVRNRADLPSPTTLLVLCFLITMVNCDCSTHAIVKSDLRTCERNVDGSRTCQLFTTAEITLPSINSESCLWFTDSSNNHLFSIRLKLDGVICKFQTKRDYFTFPVTAKHLSQISCIFNKYCGRGTHCVQRKVGTQGLHFEAETPESRDFPGVSSCVPGGIGVGCTIITRAACNFQRTWYEPDLLHSYEVSTITGHKCQYLISLTSVENNTVSRLVIKDSAYTTTGIKLTVLGAYDQPQLHITDKLIQRVGRPEEAYIAPASKRNQPKAGEIGAVQANVSYTKNFIFDPQLSTCDFFEDSLRCFSATDALETLRSSKESALPLQYNLHLFQIQDGLLTSSLLVSSAVRIQLYFSQYKISVQTITVCPKFDDNSFDTMGCYNCPLLARVTFRAHSTCQPGITLVEFQELDIYTRAIMLTEETSVHTIKFMAKKKCYNEKLCLRAQTLLQCQNFKFCLSEPTVELINLDTNYTRISSISTPSNWLEWTKLPILDSSYMILKILGSSLFIVCISITMLSTLITCCCRTR